jgi:hypothetical protein
MPITLDGTNGISTPNTLTVDSQNISATNSLGFRNRIINGDMRIDQRNAGASVTAGALQYTVDRWRELASPASKFTIQRNAGAVTPPAGFTNYLGLTSTSAYSVGAADYQLIQQFVEGFNAADLAWGTANAQAVTISCLVRSSLTGTFGGSVQNSSNNRSYPFTYTINAANTWELKTIVVPGDTTGTWLRDSGRGITLNFSIGTGSNNSGTAGAWSSSDFRSATGAVSVVGTSGATFYITGVQLEAGSVATPFERRPYGTELALCQRYYYRLQAPGVAETVFAPAFNPNTTTAFGVLMFPVTMRTRPTALEQSGTAADYGVYYGATFTNCSSVPIFNGGTNQYMARLGFTVASGLTAGQGSHLASANNNSTAFLAWSAEL